MISTPARSVALCLLLLPSAAACGGDGVVGGTLPDGAAGAAPDGAPGTPDAATDPGLDASVPFAGDPGDLGPHGVIETDMMIPIGSGVTVTIYRPDGAGPYPLIVVSPGFQMPRSQYASYGRHVASWGFVVVGQDFPSGFGAAHQMLADRTRSVIDWALSGASGLSSRIDASRIGACGHSLGGKISLLAAADDPRIGAVVGWDPVDANAPSVAPERMADIAAPVAVLGETLNGSGGFMPCAPTDQNFQQYYAAASSPALEITLDGADHMDWVDDSSCAFCGFCTPAGTLGEDLVRRVTRRATVAWFRRHLLGEEIMDAYLGGEGLAAGLPDGAVSARAK